MEIKQENENKVIKGYATGVFDLFHIGHLNIIKRAKEMCDYLIVGVSTDELVESYKHKKPVIPFEERKAIVEAIRYVDEVVPQINLNKVEAFRKYGFDIVFHGDDLKNSDLYLDAEEKFSKLGVKIVYFPYTKCTSSTLITEILNREIGKDSQK